MTVLARRYLKKDEEGNVIERPEEMFRRVANDIASADKLYGASDEEVAGVEEAFYGMMTGLEFLPNSPTLRGAGRRLQQLSGCFVVPVGDSLEDIFDAIKYAALIHKTGGGVGFSFSRLRPRGDMVTSTGNIAGGPLSFIKVFNSTAQEITQGGVRMGANMGLLSVDHPDILDFITCKRDGVSLTNFNISVAVTDAFMRAVEDDGEYDLINPRTQKTSKKLRAREVFDLIAEMAWHNGDPGVVFMDQINAGNPTPNLGRIESTNPCVTGDALVSTELGLMRMRDVVERYASGGLRVLTDDRAIGIAVRDGTTGTAYLPEGDVRLAPISRAIHTGFRDTVKIVTKSGFELAVTPDHRMMTQEGWIEAGRLRPAHHRILVQSGPGAFSRDPRLPFDVVRTFRGQSGRTYRLNLPEEWSHELGLALGWLVGDGWLRSGDRNCRVGWTFGAGDADALRTLKPILDRWYGQDVKEIRRATGCTHLSYHSTFFVRFFERLGVRSVRAGDKTVPELLFTATEEAARGFLCGLFSADGTVACHENGTRYVRLTSKSHDLLKGCQLLLIHLGIRSTIYDRNRPPRISFGYTTKGGEHKTCVSDGVCYELQISRESMGRYLKEIGFLGDKHRDKIEGLEGARFYSDRFEDEVAEVLPNGRREVYDLTEPQTHSFIVNGMITHNCGEQPLLPYESCNLGSINLSRMVADGQVDFDKLRTTVRNAVHFLDNVIDRNKYVLPEIERRTRGNRKIGMGVMGFADTLIQLGVSYNSEEGIETAKKLMGFISQEADRMSEELAEVRDVFPNFEGSVYGEKGPRLRNATRTTIAPTGTIGVIANCSSGIEPLFAIVHTRGTLFDKEGATETLHVVNPFFERVARERGFYSDELMAQIAEQGTCQGLSEVPEDVQRVFVTAHDISPEAHIRMQGAFQTHGVDNAVSKTINMRHDATVEDVKNAYMMAYKMGCKGITLYRDRSRDVQVLTSGTEEETPESERDTKAPRPRPQTTWGVTTKVGTGCGSLFVTINEDEAGLCEVFARMGRSGGCPACQTEATSRIISISLRAGVEINAILDQLRGIRCPSPKWGNGGVVLSCPDAIGIAIQRYMEGGLVRREESSTDSGTPEPRDTSIFSGRREVVGMCPECGCPMEYVEGCAVCRMCGFTRCG